MDEFIPEGLITFADGVDYVRKVRLGDAAVQPLTASEEQTLAMYREAQRSAENRPVRRGETRVMPVSTVEIRAADNKSKMISDQMKESGGWLRQKLYSMELVGCILSKQGDLRQIHPSIWGGVGFEKIMSSGRYSVAVNDFAVAEGLVLLRKEDLERVLRRIAAMEADTVADTVVSASDASSLASQQEINQGYVPPYIDLMLRAAKELGASPEKVIPKAEVERWLSTNWPSGLEGRSGEMVGYMATFIRRPEDKTGGNFKADGVKRAGPIKPLK